MDLKHVFRQIEPDCDNLRPDRPPLWIVADPPLHIDAVGGRSHHQSRKNGGVAHSMARVALRRAPYELLLRVIQDFLDLGMLAHSIILPHKICDLGELLKC